MKLSSKLLAVIIVSILFGGILISNSVGWWQTESSKEAAIFTEGEFAGLPNPADIRGSYTFGDVEANFGVPAEVMAQAFQIEAEDAGAFPVKELEGQYETSTFEIGTASVRLFVAFYNGLPYDLTGESTYLPNSAVEILQTRALSPAQRSYLADHTVALTEVGGQTTTPADAITESTVPEESGTLIKGKTTFTEVLSWGVSQQQIEEVLDMPMPAESLTVIKDFAMANGLDFETVKENLQALVDEVN